jgi:hypothetical protein
MVNNISDLLPILILSLVMLILPFPNKLLGTLILWGYILFILLDSMNGMSMVVIILWLAFGIPIAILYCNNINLLKILLFKLLRYFSG